MFYDTFQERSLTKVETLPTLHANLTHSPFDSYGPQSSMNVPWRCINYFYDTSSGYRAMLQPYIATCFGVTFSASYQTVGSLWRHIAHHLVDNTPRSSVVMAMQVGGKTAILTGAGSGITLSFAKLLLSKGCNVVIADLSLRPESEALVSQYPLSSPGAKVVYQRTDVTDWAQLGKVFEVAVQHFGGADIVCPGAGVYEPVRLSSYIRKEQKLRIHSPGQTSGKLQGPPSLQTLQLPHATAPSISTSHIPSA